MALVDMKSDLAQGVGSKQSPQSFVDGHSSTIVTGNKEFTIPPRVQIEKSKLTSISRQSETLTHEFNDKFLTKTIKEMQVPGLQKYYDRVFNDADRLGARNNDRLGFDEPFIIKGIGDRWGPGNLGSFDGGIVRAGAVTSAARTAADVQRIGKFLLTPRGVGFIAKQHILQGLNAGGPVMRSDMPPVDGSLQKIISDKLGQWQNRQLMEAKQQRFSTGRDVFGSTPPTVNEMKGSDIRSWRASSIVDSLPLTAHYVRHKIPAGSPSVQIVKNVGNFVIDMGGGTLSFMDGIDVAFPHVSLNPSFQAGDILTGAGKAIKNAVDGITEVFPNIIDAAASVLKKADFNIRLPDIPKPSLGRLFSLTSQFPFLIDIPTPQVPNLSGLQNILGGLADTTANLLKSAASGLASSLGGISIPSISLPPLPNFPSLPDIGLPSLGNPFSAIGNAVKGVSINFPKFGGKGGLNLGAIARGLSTAFPSIRLNADVSKGSLSYNMAAFDVGKAKFQSGLENLIKTPSALEMVSAKKTQTTGIPDYINNGQPYGEFANIAGSALGDTGIRASGTEDTPKLYYTTANTGVAQDSKGALRNLYDASSKYSISVNTKNPVDGGQGEHSLGINTQDNWDFDEPFAIASGFAAGAKWGVEDKNFPLNSEKRVSDKPIPVKFPENSVNHSKDKLGNRIQRYEMLSYGQLGDDFNRYGDTGHKADVTRGIGSQGSAGRLMPDDEMGVIRMSSDGKYASGLQDKINLHPYGGSTVDTAINDTDIDFIPFKFRDMVNGKWIIFRAILESVADTSSPEYAEESYIGRPDKVFVYRGSTRNFNVTFKVMPKSVQEIITLWEKLNYLRGLTYPSIQDNRMIAPFASVTVGDMVDKLPVLLQSLNYTIDTASTWEIKPGLRLPKLIQISADMRVIEPKLPQTTGKFYDLDWLRNDYEYGTFERDPKLPTSLAPRRGKYDRGTHKSKHGFPHLFEELGIQGVDEEIYNQLKAGEDQIAEAKKRLDELKSNINVPNVDIPTPLIDNPFNIGNG